VSHRLGVSPPKQRKKRSHTKIDKDADCDISLPVDYCVPETFQPTTLHQILGDKGKDKERSKSQVKQPADSQQQPSIDTQVKIQNNMSVGIGMLTSFIVPRSSINYL
jgi:hypothetical protein